MNMFKALSLFFCISFCFTLHAMVAHDLKIVPISYEEALKNNIVTLYLAKKTVGAKNPSIRVRIKNRTLSLVYPEIISDINFPCQVCSYCINQDNSRVALSLEDTRIHSFIIPHEPLQEIHALTIKSAKHTTKHMCFGPDSTLVTINSHEIICADFNTGKQTRFELENFDKCGKLVKIFPSDLPDEYVILTKKQLNQAQFLSLKLIMSE